MFDTGDEAGITAIENRISTVEDKYVKALWFESIASGTSGSVTLPTGGSIVLDQWSAGVDALASTITDGVPTFESPKTAGETIITATMDASGNYTISDTPSSYPIAVIYVYKVALKNFDYLYSLRESEVIPSLDDILPATAESSFIISGSSPFAWRKKSLSETIGILGLGALAGNELVISDGTLFIKEA